MPGHCLVHVRLLHCMHVRLHNGYMSLCTNKTTYAQGSDQERWSQKLLLSKTIRLIVASLIVNKPLSQIYTTDTRTCASLIPVWGSNWGLQAFPIIKIIMVRQVHVLLACTAVFAWRQSHIKSRTKKLQRLLTHLLWVCFCMCGWQKSEDPQIEPMAGDAITRGGMRISLVYICGPIHFISIINVNMVTKVAILNISNIPECKGLTKMPSTTIYRSSTCLALVFMACMQILRG